MNEIKQEVRLVSSKERKDPEKEKIVLTGTYLIKRKEEKENAVIIFIPYLSLCFYFFNFIFSVSVTVYTSQEL